MNLLDLDAGDSAPAPAPVAVQKLAVLNPQQAGQGGKAGFGVLAALARVSGNVVLQLSFANRSQVPMNNFAIQVNKNSFGIGPAAALAQHVNEIAPGGQVEVSLPMQPGVLPNNQPPANTLFLQVAIKNSLDVFYFNVPFDLTCVLLEGPILSRDQFSSVWQGVGEGRQYASEGVMQAPLNEEDVRQRLTAANVHYVAKRGVDNATHIYVAATATSNAVITAEVILQNKSIRLVTRTEAAQLAP